MFQKNNIFTLDNIFNTKNKHREKLFETAGIYAFWWIGPKEHLLNGNREIFLKGPAKHKDGKINWVSVRYEDWWPDDLPFPCLYVGKSTTLWKRLGLHIKRGTPEQIHKPDGKNRKVTPKTTSCQLRHGIEHVFPKEKYPLQLILDNVGFSYRTEFSLNPVAERFFAEDLYIGKWRPWFNIDSER